MNGRYFFTSAIAILAIALVGYGEASKKTGMVSIGPVMPTMSTPRVRVANDATEAVDVWVVPVGATAGHRLGSVGAVATETFSVARTVRAMRLVVRPQKKRREQYVTRDVQIDLETDVMLRVAPELIHSTVEVRRIRAVGPSMPPDYPQWPAQTTTPDG